MDRLVSVFVPDIGDFKDVKVSEILVKAGDRVNADDPLIALETDKATMEAPSPMAGVIHELKVSLGDIVSQGSLIMVIERFDEGEAPILVTSSSDAPTAACQAPIVETGKPSAPPVSAASPFIAPSAATQPPIVEARAPSVFAVPAAPSQTPAYATPSVRRQARELGVDIAKVSATGQKGRITRDDLLAYVKSVLSRPSVEPAASGAGTFGLTVAPWPIVDFAKYGPIERQPLSRIKTISGVNLARNWVTIPHVTNFDEADVTDIEIFRQAANKDAEASGVKVTMLTFLIKAVVATLKQFKTFNASLDGDALVLKNYFHIGFAADTPRGLLVPVLRDADRKAILESRPRRRRWPRRLAMASLSRTPCRVAAFRSRRSAASVEPASRPSSTRLRLRSWVSPRPPLSPSGMARSSDPA